MNGIQLKNVICHFSTSSFEWKYLLQTKRNVSEQRQTMRELESDIRVAYLPSVLMSSTQNALCPLCVHVSR